MKRNFETGAYRSYNKQIKELLLIGKSASKIAALIIAQNDMKVRHDTFSRYVRDYRNYLGRLGKVLPDNEKLNDPGEPPSKDEASIGISALVDGKIMTIDEYCKHYELPVDEVKSYKLVTHTGIPFYNIQFKTIEIQEDMEDILDRMMEKHRPQSLIEWQEEEIEMKVGITGIGDVHIGMAISDSLFGLDWNKELLFARAGLLVSHLDYDIDRMVLVIGGDLTDGINGKTVRGLKGISKHELDQNLDNEGQIDTGIDFINYILDNVTQRTTVPIDLIFLANSNHGGPSDYAVAKTIQFSCNKRYEGQVNFILQREFIASYTYLGKNFICTHGYDAKHMDRGFPKDLKPTHIKMIEKIIERDKLLGETYLFRFDQHQYFVNEQDKFQDILNPAFSNPSSWASYKFATNFKGGFVKIKIDSFTTGIELVKF